MSDPADQAEAYESLDRDLNIRRALNGMLPDTPQVVVAGDDGAPLIVCYDCEAPIPPARLAALPHALRCLPCQEAYERFKSLHPHDEH